MKIYSIIFPSILGLLLVFSSCEEDPPALNLPVRYDVPVLLGTHIEYYDLQEIRFNADIAVFKGDNSINEVNEFTGLPDSSFKFTDYTITDGTWVRHYVDKVVYADTADLNTFTSVFLIDQSASPENFDSTDYYNQRFQALNALLKNLNGQGKIVFAYFNRKTTGPVMKLINSDPVDSWDENIARSLLDLTHKQSGTSGLFDALDQAITLIASMREENSSVTLFVRNKDDGQSSASLENLVLKAQANNIKVNVIWLIYSDHTQNVDFPTLRQLATRTGGFTVYMNRIYQSNSVFIRLPQLLKGETDFYRIYTRITLAAPNFFSTRYSTGVRLYYNDPTRPFTWSYIPLFLEKP